MFSSSGGGVVVGGRVVVGGGVVVGRGVAVGVGVGSGVGVASHSSSTNVAKPMEYVSYCEFVPEYPSP